MPEEVSDKRIIHRRTITLSVVWTVLSMTFVVLPIIGAILKPFAVEVMSSAVAGEVQSQQQKGLAPITSGIKVIIQANIDQLEDDLASLQVRHDAAPMKWTVQDAKEYLDKTRKLAAQRKALEEIEGKK